MAIEIERKFLVKSDDFKKYSHRKYNIQQGFLSTDKERTVRIRVLDDAGFITVKGLSSNDGLSRFEWEKEISVNEAKELLLICEEYTINKIRYEVKVNKHTFEIDEFLDNNEGLTIAEVELNSVNENVDLPIWLGKEVTGDVKYYNSSLSKNPFKNW